MKHITSMILAVVVAASTADAQTIDSALGYFPLHVGNQWTYTHSESQTGRPTQTTRFTIRVVADTMIDGRRYFVVEGGGSTAFRIPRRLSVDSASGIIYKWENEAAAIYDRLRCARERDVDMIGCGAVGTENVLGTMRTVRHGVERITLQTRFAYGIGYFFGTFNNEFDRGESDELTYARVGGIEYGSPTGVEPIADASLTGVHMYVSPNPSASATSIGFRLPTAGHVRIAVHDALGRCMSVLGDGEYEAGEHIVPLDAATLAAGVYYATVTTAHGAWSERVVILR